MRCPPDPNACVDLDLCVFGGSLHWNAAKKCLTATKTPLPDGWVRSFLVVNNCIVDYSYDEPDYRATIAPCAPVPDDCNGSGGGGYPLSNDPANLTQIINGELLTKLYYEGSGLVITGNGTASSPLRIVYSPSQAALAVTGIAPISVTGSGIPTDPMVVSFVPPNGALQGTYGGLIFNMGIAVGSAPDPTSAIRGLIAGNGIAIDFPQGPTSTISMAATGAMGTYQFGDKEVSVDASGRIVGVRTGGTDPEPGPTPGTAPPVNTFTTLTSETEARSYQVPINTTGGTLKIVIGPLPDLPEGMFPSLWGAIRINGVAVDETKPGAVIHNNMGYVAMPLAAGSYTVVIDDTVWPMPRRPKMFISVEMTL